MQERGKLDKAETRRDYIAGTKNPCFRVVVARLCEVIREGVRGHAELEPLKISAVP